MQLCSYAVVRVQVVLETRDVIVELCKLRSRATNVDNEE
jgi:hypothetical protein